MHCVLFSFSSNSHNSMFPTSRIICFDSGLKGLNDWFCRRSCWRACRFGWFSIFWINCRTLILCACFTTECGSPGILKSMSASFTIIGSWFSSWTTMDFSILLRSTSSSTLSVLASWFSWQASCTAAVSVTGRSVSADRLVLSEELDFFVKRINIDLLRTGRVSSIFHVIKSPWSDTNWIWSWLEKLGLSKNFSFWLSSSFTFWLLNNFRTQFSCPFVT